MVSLKIHYGYQNIYTAPNIYFPGTALTGEIKDILGNSTYPIYNHSNQHFIRCNVISHDAFYLRISLQVNLS